MKKKLLLLAIATVLTAPATFAADTASDTQIAAITVPEVDLLDVGTEGATTVDTITLTLTAPTEAGAGFDNTTGSSTYKISANNAADGSSGKNKITVTASGGTIPNGGTLTISTSALGGGTANSVALSGDTSTTTGTLMTNIGNVASSAGVLNYTFGPTTAGGMVGYTATTTNITLTYTLEDV